MAVGLGRSRNSPKVKQFGRAPSRCHADEVEVFLLCCDAALHWEPGS